MGAIIVDLDGTLCDHSKRQHFAVEKKWDEYNARIHEDVPVKSLVQLILAMQTHGHMVILCTGRFRAYSQVTIDWLNIYGIEWDRLFMRPDGDYRPDWEVKQDMLKNEIRFEAPEILFVIDDRKSVVDMWRRNGLLVFHCAEGDF